MLKRLLAVMGIVVVAGLAALQAVPYGRQHGNPPVRQEPRWDRAETRTLARRACYDCHSNETTWPWYSHVAPLSWLIQRDVDEGRRALNFSEWDRRQKEAHEAGKTLREGEMPPWFYATARPEARLSAADQAALAGGLDATVGPRQRGRAERAGHDED